MADLITYTDKEQGQSNPAPIVQKVTFGDMNEIKTVVNQHAEQFSDLDEQAVTSPLIEASVTGTYTFDLSTSKSWLLTMTGNTTFSVSTLPISKDVSYTVELTGDFVPTLTDVNVFGDTYDGTIRNLLAFRSYRTAAGTQVNDLIITNLA